MLPKRFESIVALEDALSAPSAALTADLAGVPGDIMVLGVGGKIGPTLARMAKRAAPERRVIGVARFTEPGLRESLTAHGVECIACDLLDPAAVAALPRAPNVIFMAGRKFGSNDRQELTWAINGWVPSVVAQVFQRSRIVAFSTACVYAFANYRSGGAREDAPLIPPGEYANSCVARERMFEYFSGLHATPGRLIRLSYAIDMRYGVLHDLARRLLAREPIDLAMGYVNVTWQGDANEQALRALAHCTTPTSGLNVSGPIRPVRELATGLGERLGVKPIFVEVESDTAWLINCSAAERLFGPPRVSMETLLDWTADWVQRGMASHGKPTHFEVRDGSY